MMPPGERRVAALIAAVADAAAELPGVTVEREADRVVLIGRGLSRRMATDARLRGIGLWARSAR